MLSLLKDIALPFAILFGLLCIALLFIGKRQDANAQALLGEQLIAVARLSDKTTFTSSGIHKDRGFEEKGPTRYTLHYQYTHPLTSLPFESQANVEKATWDAMQIDQYYQILVSRQDPQLTSLFHGQEFVDGAQLAYRLAALFGVLGLLCVVLRFVASR
ncbi:MULTISPECIES: hypothetical protein [Deefgea]|uniref:DUF3592 domain-containing protein n=1 Tax=Deefgea chitinilytica TaxID=570276 RepID=A0ABS2CDM3_9NEIS|nr:MULTISPECIES: hypothetical protein [Deefgea]MBM5572225.1 hypothetical protein [Deefgea chitinilytica]MBM9889460.1 hypothetical protein [Deefgea sp. CFH1-16]